MDRTAAIDHLPDTYQQILRWLDDGLPDEEIASRLDLEPEATRSLMTVARAKLDRLIQNGTEIPT